MLYTTYVRNNCQLADLQGRQGATHCLDGHLPGDLEGTSWKQRKPERWGNMVVYFMENPSLKWMIWGYPYDSGNHHMGISRGILTRLF